MIYSIIITIVECTPEFLESVVYGYGLTGHTKEEIEDDFGCLYKISSFDKNEERNEIIESIQINYNMKWFKENDFA